jgi:hypothetical protein
MCLKHQSEAGRNMRCNADYQHGNNMLHVLCLAFKKTERKLYYLQTKRFLIISYDYSFWVS